MFTFSFDQFFTIFRKLLETFQFYTANPIYNLCPISERLNIQPYTKVLEHFQYRKKRFSKKTIKIGKQSELFHDCRLITIYIGTILLYRNVERYQ